MLNTQTVVRILGTAGLVAHKKMSRTESRPGYTVRKLSTKRVGIIFDTLSDGHGASLKAQSALQNAGLAFRVMEDGQTLTVAEMKNAAYLY